MKKNLIVSLSTVLSIAAIVTFLVLSNYSSVSKIYGTYTYSECVYLNPLSSSTIDYQTEINENKFTYNLEDYEFFIYNADNEIIEEYADIEYVNVDLYFDVGEFSNFGTEGFLDNVETRYDIYSEGIKIEYALFVGSEDIYLAETRMIGEDNSVLTFWTVFIID